ncbi:DCL family protein [Pararhodobacter oceanensis]|uniref:DCL family protein n=1 Tax=Pararhodobacter oceanensis TaxID=2172121 RepID=UPI003A8CF8F2
MPAKPVKIGTLSFSKKGDANEFFRKMLYKYELGDKVTDGDAEILTHLVQMHSEATEKIGAGIESFSVRTADYGTRCFWVNRIDGTTERFSFRACY